MTRTAKLFINGKNQAVRLPQEWRFEGKEVYIRRDAITGDIVLSERPHDWDALFESLLPIADSVKFERPFNTPYKPREFD